MKKPKRPEIRWGFIDALLELGLAPEFIWQRVGKLKGISLQSIIARKGWAARAVTKGEGG